MSGIGTMPSCLGCGKHEAELLLGACAECTTREAHVILGKEVMEDPAAFWRLLAPAQALALLKAAPKVAGPWESPRSYIWRRVAPNGAFAATVTQYAGDEFFAQATGVGRDHETLDAAKAAADAELRSKGWVFE